MKSELNIPANNLLMYNKWLNDDQLSIMMAISDLFLAPYIYGDGVTSGTITNTFRAGLPSVSSIF